MSVLDRYLVDDLSLPFSLPDISKLPDGEIKKAGGANIHFKGTQDKGKTMLMIMFYRYLIKQCGYSPKDGVGNLSLSKYGDGFQTLKGDDLHQYLWDLTHKPYRDKIVMIDEIDSEFPARFHQDRDQTEIALRMWHNRKLRNYIMFTSHLGRGADLIFDLATNFVIFPSFPKWDEDKIDFTVFNKLDLIVSEFEAFGIYDIVGTYDRWEMTEKTSEDSQRKRKKKKELSTNRKKRDGEKKLQKNIVEIVNQNLA